MRGLQVNVMINARILFSRLLLYLLSVPWGAALQLCSQQLQAAAVCRGGTPVALFMAALSERTVIYCVPSSAAVKVHHGDRDIQWNPDFQSDTEVKKGELAG